MASGLAKIKRRISSIQATRKVTNAMELISSVKLMRKRKAMDNTVKYTAVLSSIISSCSQGLENGGAIASPLMEENKDPKVQGNLYVALTSSLGLCGGYNLNLIKFLTPLLTKDDELVMMGTRGLSKIDPDLCPIDESQVNFLDDFDYSKAQKIRKVLQEAYLSGKYKSVILVYTKYKNPLAFIPSQETILPIKDFTDNGKIKNGSGSSAWPPDFLPSKEEVFRLLIPKYLDSLLYERFIESLVSEEGARRNAMEDATDNADDLSSKLTVVYNKARQTEITTQINEIMTGRMADEE
jgi:F-type H+-transporting ATPase subunit gamma